MRYADILNEMLIRYQPDELGDSALVVAHRDSLWIIPSRGTGDGRLDRRIKADIRKRTGLRLNDLDDLQYGDPRDGRPDIFFGRISDGVLYVDGRAPAASHNPMTSPLVKKVAQHLRIHDVKMEFLGDDGDDYQTSIMPHGDIPEIVWHGTHSGVLHKILKTGIRPTETGNWGDIKFKNKIFLTSIENFAMYHANGQARAAGTQAVVLGTRIPDRSKITLDFDVARSFIGPDRRHTDREGYTQLTKKDEADYDKNRVRAIRKHSPGTDWTRATGVFGYRGWIPPSFFQTVFMAPAPYGEAEPMTSYNLIPLINRKELMDAIAMIHEHGFYDPDYEPEEDEEF